MTFAFRGTLLLLAAVPCCQGAQVMDLAGLEAIPDMVKRSRQALEFAAKQLDVAIDAYQAAELEQGRQILASIGSSVELAVNALKATGKYARRHPRHFKYAEIRTRRLLLRIHQARLKANLEDQRDFDGLIERIEAANDRLLFGIMGPRN